VTIPLQQGIIYGPINSRRLGRSLGINVLPTQFKMCSFNCVYCQYGWTPSQPQKFEWLTVREILLAVEGALENVSPAPDFITFSGNGEPTLHPDFPELVTGVCQLRDRYSPQSRTALLSNSTTVTEQKIRKAIYEIDVAIMKLDCGEPTCFLHYNRPNIGISLEEIVGGFRKIRGITIQSLFTGGAAGNFTDRNVDAWIEKLVQISPDYVQLYTLDRGYPSKQIEAVSTTQLLSIRKKLVRAGVPAAVYE